MEKDTAFDLNQRIFKWRNELKNRPAIRAEDIEELESHLRDTMAALSRGGLSEEESFLVAARRVGHPDALEAQFDCANPGAVWKERGRWMVLGILSLWVASSLAKAGSSLVLWLGGGVAGSGYALGWAALAIQLLLVFCFGWLVIGRKVLEGASTAQSRPARSLTGRWIIFLSVGTVVLGLSAWLLQTLAIRETGPRVIGMYLLVTQWGAAMLLPAAVIGVGLWLASSQKAKRAGGVAMVLSAGLLIGCKPGGTESKPASASQASTLESCLALINSDTNAAVEAFLNLDLTKGELFSPGSPLSYSESEFVRLPAAARDRLGQQAFADVGLVKRLASETRSRRDSARAAGQPALAEKCNAQLAKLGQRLEGPDNLKLTQLVGKTLGKIAAE